MLKSLSNLKKNPVTEEHRISNCEKVINALSEIGLSTHFTAMDLARPSARECLLFILLLYQGLPHYIPKTQIPFPCVLGEVVTKTIELQNPSSRPVSYFVSLEGSSDFSVQEGVEYVSIPPRGTV